MLVFRQPLKRLLDPGEDTGRFPFVRCCSPQKFFRVFTLLARSLDADCRVSEPASPPRHRNNFDVTCQFSDSPPTAQICNDRALCPSSTITRTTQ